MILISCLAPWFGSNRMLANHVGKALEGCNHVCIPFAGGMAELQHIKARTILVNDLHRLIINLAKVIANDNLRPLLIGRLLTKAFHPDELIKSQNVCKSLGSDLDDDETSLVLAEHYFVCCWMNRSGMAGTKNEFDGRLAIRWESGGGDSVVRYHNAIAIINRFSEILKRCQFSTLDVFDFLDKIKDRAGHGIYCDPPFPGVGLKYKFGPNEEEEYAWHKLLANKISTFNLATVVMRFYNHEWVHELYPADKWCWCGLEGRKQTNEAAPEVLLIKNG